MTDDVNTPPPGGGHQPTPEQPVDKPSGEVVSLADAATRRASKEAPAAMAGAAAPESGTGGGKAPSKSAPKKAAKGKPDKVIDWGKVTFLVEHFALIYGTDTVWDGAKRMIMKIANMAHAHGADMVRLWKASEKRRTVMPEDVVFDPTETCDLKRCVNLYNGFATEPAPCEPDEVKPMLDLLLHLCSNSASPGASVEQVMHWVLCWLALPLQRPGAKLRSALVFHGPQGTGKNMFFDVVRRMYGKYGVMVGQNELEEKFNDWLSGKLLVIGNEVVTRQELFHNKNKLKWIITEDQIPIRAMQQSVRWEANHANVVFLSNEQMPLVLEDGDRRHLVVYTPLSDETGLYDNVTEFLADDGAAKFMHYLLNYPLQGFHEHTKPLMTSAKADLQELSMRPPERFMTEWMAGFIPLPVQVCSGDQLYRAFESWSRRSGLRWVDDQAKFTSLAKRWSQESVERDDDGQRLPPRLEYKVFQLTGLMADNGRKAMRCWLPRGTGPLPGVTEGAWASESVQAFELPLGRYLRTRQEGGEAEEPAEPKGKP